MARLIDFLQNNLPQVWNKTWDAATMPMVYTTTSHRIFWVVDDQSQPFRDNNKDGGAAFDSAGGPGQILVVHFEDFIKKLTKGGVPPSKCDCIVEREIGNQPTIVFVELTERKRELLENKRKDAFENQLPKSISYFNQANPQFFDHYHRRVALFAYHITDVPANVSNNHPMKRQKRVLQKQTLTYGNVRHTAKSLSSYASNFPDGFELHECCAPSFFKL